MRWMPSLAISKKPWCILGSGWAWNDAVMVLVCHVDYVLLSIESVRCFALHAFKVSWISSQPKMNAMLLLYTHRIVYNEVLSALECLIIIIANYNNHIFTASLLCFLSRYLHYTILYQTILDSSQPPVTNTTKSLSLFPTPNTWPCFIYWMPAYLVDIEWPISSSFPMSNQYARPQNIYLR